MGAGAGCAHLAQNRIGDPLNLTAAVAGRAGFVSHSFGRNRLGDFNFFLNPFGNFFQGQFDPNAQICASVGPTPASATATKKALKGGTIAEDIPKLREDILHGESTSATTHALVNSLMAKTIVTSTLVGIAQNFVGLGCFLEFLFGLGIPGVFVGMELQSRLAIGFFDFVFTGLTAYPQHFVIVSLGHNTG